VVWKVVKLPVASVTEKRVVVNWWENYLGIRYEGWAVDMGTRGRITEYSRGSESRMRQSLDNVAGEVLPWVSFLTLTYPAVYPKDGREVKRHLKMLGQRLMRWFPEFTGFWAMEFQGRGAPHFMVLSNVFVHHKVLGRLWYEVVDSGDPKHLRAGVQAKKPEGEVKAYFLKRYFRKGDQKQVPADFSNPGRFWGSWGQVGRQLGEEEVSEAQAVKVKRTMRRCVEARLGRGRRLPREVREGKHCGVRLFRGGEKLMGRLLIWATGEVVAGR